VSANATGIDADGIEVRGWTSVKVARALMQAAGTFRIELPGSDPTFLRPGAFVRIGRGRTRIAAGYVDAVDHQIRGGSSGRVFVGRDATSDAYDACPDVAVGKKAKQPTKSWINATPSTICRDLLAPFGLKVLVLGGTVEKPIGNLAVDVGESSFEVIDRALRIAGLICYSDNGTRLAIGRPSQERLAEELVYGRNVVDVSLAIRTHDRYSKVVVVGQRRGTDGAFGILASGQSGVAYDEEVKRPRPLVMQAETGGDPGSLQTRAEFEVAVRAARGDRVSVTVRGWERRGDATGDLWNVNQLVRLTIPPMLIDGDFLIDAVMYQEGQGEGATATLELVRPGAYLPEPVIEKQSGPLARYLAQQPGTVRDDGSGGGPEDDPDAQGDGEER
jgi:prophage tail gpP-like protein